MDVSKQHQALLKKFKKQIASLRQREEQAIRKVMSVMEKIKALGTEYQAKLSKRIVKKVKKLKSTPKRKTKAAKRGRSKSRR